MGPQPDVERLKEIYRAEREADRIVREAGEAARALVADAKTEAENSLARRGEESARKARESLERTVAQVRGETDAFLDASRSRIKEWLLESERSADAVVDELFDGILPP